MVEIIHHRQSFSICGTVAQLASFLVSRKPLLLDFGCPEVPWGAVETKWRAYPGLGRVRGRPVNEIGPALHP